MSGKKSLFLMLLVVAAWFCSVPSTPIAAQLCTNCIQLCTQMSSWAVWTIGQNPWWVMFLFLKSKK